MKDKLLRITRIVFYGLVGIFILLLGYFIAVPESLKRTLFPVAAGLAVVFFISGGVLVFLAWKLKVEKKLKVFLVLTGASSAGFLVFSVLHNFFYAWGIYFSDIAIVASLMEILHVASFLIAIFVCPIVFLVGMIGSMIVKQKF